MTGKSILKQSTVVPAGLIDVALIDAQACAAAGSMSVSWWHAEVAAGRAPAPVIRKPRCTRWRLADVREFLVQIATQSYDQARDKAVIARATKASLAAQAKRDS